MEEDGLWQTKEDIRKQIEFYFGDENYKNDKFLRKMSGEDGFTLISSIAEFKKIKSLSLYTNNIYMFPVNFPFVSYALYTVA
jgi:hypothetical protein